MMCSVLGKKNMRTSTNTILLAISVTNTLTSLVPFPYYLTFFTFEKHQDFLPNIWCYLYPFLNIYCPLVFHHSSMWLLLWLAIQRYFHVCKSTVRFTRRNIRLGIAIIYLIPCIVHLWTLFVSSCSAVSVPSMVSYSVSQINFSRIFKWKNSAIFVPDEEFHYDLIETYVRSYKKWYIDNNELIQFLNYLLRMVFINIVPSFLLIILNGLLIWEIKRAAERRRRILRTEYRSYNYCSNRTRSFYEVRRISESNRTTLMLVLVVSITVLLEVPLGIFLLYSKLDVISEEAESKIALLFNMCTLITHPINFLLLCGMSTQFRKTFKKIYMRRFSCKKKSANSNILTPEIIAYDLELTSSFVRCSPSPSRMERYKDEHGAFYSQQAQSPYVEIRSNENGFNGNNLALPVAKRSV